VYTDTNTASISVNDRIKTPPHRLNHKREPIDTRFWRWIAKNPIIVELFLKFAREVRQAGLGRYSISALTERVRWEVNIAYSGRDEFKISNDYRSRLARLLMQMDPILEGFFELRPLRSIDKPTEVKPPNQTKSANAQIE
jgi:hypothetical protein